MLCELHKHGHTPQHQSWQVTLPSGQRVLLAEEAGDVWETLWHLRLSVIPGHDPTIWPEMRQAPAYYA